MNFTPFAFAAAVVLGTLAAIPAHADDWHGRGREWRGHEWREQRGGWGGRPYYPPPVVYGRPYYRPPVVYAPPPVIYAPPPPVVYAPPPAIVFGAPFIGLSIR